ncbi:MAG: hypothetical protein ACNYPH_03205 [Gammaproteobacteria bacterium WSBS_2016_MAG_OTU1]
MADCSVATAEGLICGFVSIDLRLIYDRFTAYLSWIYCRFTADSNTGGIVFDIIGRYVGTFFR